MPRAAGCELVGLPGEIGRMASSGSASSSSAISRAPVEPVMQRLVGVSQFLSS